MHVHWCPRCKVEFIPQQKRKETEVGDGQKKVLRERNEEICEGEGKALEEGRVLASRTITDTKTILYARVGRRIRARGHVKG